ncbi:hypothetical protein [Rummeliibacillus suwonensis]
MKLIREIHQERDGCYGAPKIFEVLKKEDYKGSIIVSNEL